MHLPRAADTRPETRFQPLWPNAALFFHCSAPGAPHLPHSPEQSAETTADWTARPGGSGTGLRTGHERIRSGTSGTIRDTETTRPRNTPDLSLATPAADESTNSRDAALCFTAHCSMLADGESVISFSRKWCPAGPRAVWCLVLDSPAVLATPSSALISRR